MFFKAIFSTVAIAVLLTTFVAASPANYDGVILQKRNDNDDAQDCLVFTTPEYETLAKVGLSPESTGIAPIWKAYKGVDVTYQALFDQFIPKVRLTAYSEAAPKNIFVLVTDQQTYKFTLNGQDVCKVALTRINNRPVTDIYVQQVDHY